MTQREKYVLAQRVLHWIMAVIILSLIAVGWYMTGIPKDGDAELRRNLYLLHKSFGTLVLLLVCVRLYVRLKYPAPPLPAGLKPIERRMARLAYAAFYCLMIALPVLGIAISNGYGLSVQFFGITLPRIFPVNRDMAELASELHAVCAYTLLGLVGIHVAAVIKHAVIDKVNLLKRMT